MASHAVASYCSPAALWQPSASPAHYVPAFCPAAGAHTHWLLPEQLNSEHYGTAISICKPPSAAHRNVATKLRMRFSRRDPDRPRGLKRIAYDLLTSAQTLTQVNLAQNSVMFCEKIALSFKDFNRAHILMSDSGLQGVLVGVAAYAILTLVPWKLIELPSVSWSLLPNKVAQLTLPGKGHSAGARTAIGEAQSWDDLTSKQRVAAQMLGFDQELWDSDSMVAIDRKSWDQLTDVEKRAATTLSFDQKFWDEDVFVDIYERAWVEPQRNLDRLQRSLVARYLANVHNMPALSRMS